MISFGNAKRGRFEAAASWQLKLEAGSLTPAERDAFEHWLELPPNRAALNTVRTTNNLLRHARDDERMRQRQEAARSRAARYRHERRSYAYALAASLLFLGGTLAWALLDPGQVSRYATGAQQPQIVDLADGSRISMDRNTIVNVRLKWNHRDLHVSQGQAQFQVAHDPFRPFSVTADSRVVLATGTEFNINSFAGKLVVTLVQGRVIVLPSDHWTPWRSLPGISPPVGSVTLNPGDQLVAELGEANEIRRLVDPTEALAWQQNRLVADNLQLSEIIPQLNRYGTPKIEIGSPQTGRKRISGRFNNDDPTAFAAAASALLRLKKTTKPDGTIVLSGS